MKRFVMVVLLGLFVLTGCSSDTEVAHFERSHYSSVLCWTYTNGAQSAK